MQLQPAPPATSIRRIGFEMTGLLALLGLVCLAGLPAGGAETLACPPYAPAPADNPLKGFVPYSGRAPAFPHSMEFGYLPLASLMSGPNAFQWAPLEGMLDDISSRGCQAVFRIYLEYPGRPSGLPAYLAAAGVQVRAWTNSNTQPLAAAVDHTPDYEDPRLRAALTRFIAALGSRYDGDPRIGFITAGLLGTWGEWHCHPHAEWFASKTVQAEVLEAYATAFHHTPVLLRYPAGEGDPRYTPTHRRAFGYHDDSFAWATLETGRREDGWFFLSLLRRAGPEAANRWRTSPIGGEIRPELWPCLWSREGCREGQDFARSVRETHASWLLDSSTSHPMDPVEKERALAAARGLGYEFQVVSAAVARVERRITLTITLANRGVAPFYQNWPVLVTARSAGGPRIVGQLPFQLPDLQPGATDDKAATLDLSSFPSGRVTLSVSVPNPLKGGKPLRFANLDPLPDPSGALALGDVMLP
ncbi:MAG TPA: DUF4832 domain-containing protein [Verrucomicrobiales bacterium]|nr:DUF4832 domain-containing protein [Verrucomicrobiales bacterium]